MLPTIRRKVFEEMGRLCAAWAFLEVASEMTLWGLLEVDARIGELVTSRLDLRGRWSMIIDHAKQKHDTTAQSILKQINKDIAVITHDRNVIIHGIITSKVGEAANIWAMAPAWSVQRGASAGKRFPVSVEAVVIVRENIQKTANKVMLFNNEHHYLNNKFPEGEVVASWPNPL